MKECGLKRFDKRGLDVPSYCLNSNSNLIEYFNDLGKKNHLFHDFANELEILGSIGMNTSDHIIDKYEEYKFHKSGNLLLLVLHNAQLEL